MTGVLGIVSTILAIITALSALWVSFKTHTKEKYRIETPIERLETGVAALQISIGDLEKQKAITNEILAAQLRHSLVNYYERLKIEKKVSQSQLDDICSLFKYYKNLGGDGYVDELYNEMTDWEVV